MSFYFSCLTDCGQVVSSSSKLTVTSRCVNAACENAIYLWSLEKFNGNFWENVPDLANMTATTANTSNIVIKPNALQPNSTYRITLRATSLLGLEGSTLLKFTTAGMPYGGHCKPSVSEGVTLETEFIFECIGWQDKTELTYEFRLQDKQISYGAYPKSSPTFLPQGLSKDDYRISISIIIKNALGVSVVQTFSVKVYVTIIPRERVAYELVDCHTITTIKNGLIVYFSLKAIV